MPMTHCSAGVCNDSIPTIQLTSYTAVWTGGNNGSTDDEVYSVGLPFPITLYNTQSNSVQVTTNGVSCQTRSVYRTEKNQSMFR